jgi:hypothetical protein
VQRREATLLLRKIASFPEVMPFTCVYLSNHLDNFELHVKTSREHLTQVVIEHIALQEGLRVREEPDGFLVFYKPERRLLEITA